MAIRQIVVSDIGGAELEDGQVARVKVSGHPTLGQRTVELDIGVDEAKGFEDSAKDFVYLEVEVPGAAPKEVMLDVAAFEKAIGGKANVEGILANARDASRPETTRRRRRSAATPSNGASGPKIDYKNIDNIGLEHRGRVTEEEARMVRESLDRANINRAREGQPPIDPSDPKMKKRYGF